MKELLTWECLTEAHKKTFKSKRHEIDEAMEREGDESQIDWALDLIEWCTRSRMSERPQTMKDILNHKVS